MKQETANQSYVMLLCIIVFFRLFLHMKHMISKIDSFIIYVIN